MLPVVTWMQVFLLLITTADFSGARVDVDQEIEQIMIDPWLFRAFLLCYPVFLLLVEFGQAAVLLLI